MRRRKVVTGVLLAVGSLAGAIVFRRALCAASRPGRRLLRGRLDGLARRRRRPRRRPCSRSPAASSRPPAAESWTTPRCSRRCASTPTWRATSSCARASGRRTTSTSTASRPCPSCSRRSGPGSRRKVAEVEPDARRLAGPELGAVALAAAASLASRLPFLIVRGEAKAYGTGNRHRGRVRAGRARRPGRGRRHVGRCGRRCRPGGTASCAGMPHGDLRHRPGGGRCRRPRAPRRAPASPVSCGRRRRGPVGCRKAAWLSGMSRSGRFRPVIHHVQRRRS